jgi:ribosomal protein S18 acetylase RimI-like enzyme
MDPQGITIREAGRRDVEAVTALWWEMMQVHGALDARFRYERTAARDVERHIFECIRSRAVQVYVAEMNGRVVGYITGQIQGRQPVSHAGRFGFIAELSVCPDARRNGIGKRLVEKVMAWFAQQKVTAVELFVLENNPVSNAFWQSMGFGSYLRMLRREMDQKNS